MGLLNLFGKKKPIHLAELKQGSFTVDAQGNILASTLPSNFPQDYINAIAQNMLSLMRESRSTGIITREVTLYFSALKITAKELHGGALIHIIPVQP